MMGLILLTRYASALCLMLGATHLIALCATLVEQSSAASLASELADSLSVDYPAQVTHPWLALPLQLPLQLKKLASNLIKT